MTIESTVSATSRRDGITSLFDAARVPGVAYLTVIVLLGRITIPDLVDVTGDVRQTIAKYLSRSESRGLLLRIQNGHSDYYYPTPQLLALFGLEGRDVLKILTPALSSSDQLLSERASGKRADPEEEEAMCQKNYLVRYYDITGDMAQAIVEDPWITPEYLVAWMTHVKGQQRDGRRFRKSPEAYAITCLLNHHEPPHRALLERGLNRTLRLAGYQWPDEDNEDEMEEGADD